MSSTPSRKFSVEKEASSCERHEEMQLEVHVKCEKRNVFRLVARITKIAELRHHVILGKLLTHTRYISGRC